MDIKKIAKQVSRKLAENYGSTVEWQRVFTWLTKQDEDNLVSKSAAELADDFFCDVFE